MKGETMKQMIKRCLGLGAMLAAMSALAAGDVFEIVPARFNATTFKYESYTDSEGKLVADIYKTKPLKAGDSVYFMVRLVTRSADRTGGTPAAHYQLDYFGSSINTNLAWIISPPQLGIFVGDRSATATMVQQPTRTPGSYTDSTVTMEVNYVFDTVYEYVVKPGDLGKPIVLALKDGTKATVDATTGTVPSTAYAVLNTDIWRVRYYDNAGKLADKDEEKDAIYTFVNPGDQTLDWVPESDAWFLNNYSLARCGFYAETVDFDRDEVRNPGWKTVKQGKTNKTSVELDGGEAFATNMVKKATFYVWAVDSDWFAKMTNDTIKTMPTWVTPAVEADGVESSITVWSDSSKQTVKRATVDLAAGAIYANFKFSGKTKGEKAVLILSGSSDFSFNSAGVLNQDFLTAEVECVESVPELTLERTDLSTLVYSVTSNYSESVTALKLTLTDAFTEEMQVTITPELENEKLKTAYTWSDLARLDTEVLDPGVVPAATPVTVTIPANKTSVSSIYLYGMGASADNNHQSDGKGNKVNFKVEVTPASAAAFLEDHIVTSKATLYLTPAAPVIENKAELEDISVNSGVAKAIAITVGDNYTDINDTATGYRVYRYWYDSPSSKPSESTIKTLTDDELEKLLIKTADGKYSRFYPDTDGNLRALADDGTKLEGWPAIPAAQEKDYLLMWMVAPNKAKSEYLEVHLTITESPKVTAVAYDSSGIAQDSFAELTSGSETQASIGVEIDNGGNKSGQTLYAFLEPVDPNMTNYVSGSCVLINGAAKSGMRIYNGKTETSKADRGTIKLLDGIEGGTELEFKVVLCKDSKTYDAKNVFSDYLCKETLVLTVANVAPSVDNIHMNGWELDDDKSAFEEGTTVTKGVDQKFTFDITEVKSDLQAKGSEAFDFSCSFTGCSPKTKKFTHSGDLSDYVITNKFNDTGTCTMEVKLTDKDGGKFSKKYTFEVTDHPFITIAGVSGVIEDETSGVSFYETGTPTFSVTLSSNESEDPLTVELTVKKEVTSDAGLIELDEGDFTKKVGSDNVYVCTFSAGDYKNQHTFSVKAANGTKNGSKLTFSAKVTTTTEVPDAGTTWDKYYTEGKLPVLVNNAKPTAVVDGQICKAADDDPTNNDTIYLNSSNAPIQVAIGDAVSIDWNIDDVEADLKQGIHVTIGDQSSSKKLDGDYYDTTEHTTGLTFKYVGQATMTMIVKDKDGGSITIVRYYQVKATRMLNITAVGPSSGSSAPHVQHYRGAGMGMGHVWTSSDVSDSSNWSFDFNCGLNTYVTAYAQGYRAGDVDDGKLSTGKDIPIDKTGKKTDAAPYYQYESVYDSFLYCWVKDVYESGSLASEIFGAVSLQAYTNELLHTTINLPTEADDEGSYDNTMFEAIFSRELKVSDNIGDINADGIPDLYAKGYAFDVYDDSGNVTGNDMKDLSQWNDDGDYFPFIFGDVQSSFVFMPSNDWTAASKKFNALLEVRGWGECLNDAWQVLYDQGKASGIMQYASDKCFDNPAVNTNSTLTALEYDAYVQAGKPANWSPERPTDPTLEDTDGDGMPDGYEYYIWYKAHVGWMDSGDTHTYLTGRKYNPANPYNPFDITSKEIAAAFDPLTANYDWDTRDTDDDGISDYGEYLLGTNPFDYDTDNDYLPDLYEVAITTTDPLKYATDSVHWDGSLNTDNDSMAAITETMCLFSVVGDNGAEYYCYDGSAGDCSLTVSTNVLKGTVFGIDYGLYTNKYLTVRDWAANTYTNDAGQLCLCDGFNAYNTWLCTTKPITNGAPESVLVRTSPVSTLSCGRVVSGGVETDAEYHDQTIACSGHGNWYVAYQYQNGTDLESYARGCQVAYSEVAGKSALWFNSSRSVMWLHYHVYQKNGFDPRTGWFHPPTQGSENTTAYWNIDEFLSMVYFYRNGTIPLANLKSAYPRPTRLEIWQKYSTSPTSADTDGDSMPDGWEFYLMAQTGEAAPGSDYSPITDFRGISSSSIRDNDSDKLEWPGEYSGTVSSARYGWSPLYASWRNKEQPTDPWDSDTDGDGIRDGYEGGLGVEDDIWPAKFVYNYAMYNDTGMAGGGLNPLSMDTDGDLLPDPWEIEFHGTYKPSDTYTEEVSTVADGVTNTTLRTFTTGTTWNMDGMDATVADARLDYDFDGLDNWQEYMVGAMRCWRYDDPVSPWGVHTMSFTNMPAAGTMAWNQFWHDRLLDVMNTNGMYNPHLANGYFDPGTYFTLCNNEWDKNGYGEYFMFRDGPDHCLQEVAPEKPSDNPWYYKHRFSEEAWIDATYNYADYPSSYICCDPRQEDSDGDGMDDFYELFHGMNPLLGAPGVSAGLYNGKPNPHDVVYSAYINSPDTAIVSISGTGSAYPPSALNNWWLNDENPHAKINIKNKEVGGYDFISCPWLNGLVGADPDGDNIVNQEESIMPNLQASSTYHHSDPTPLWMTDTSYTNSLTYCYYHVYEQDGDESTSYYEFADDATTFYWDGKTYNLSDFDGFEKDGDNVRFSYSLNNFYAYYGWLYSFEENEGYDSDHDFLSDYEEGQGKTKNASDPLVHDDPIRRQAMYFNGVDAFLQTPIAEPQEVPCLYASSEARQNFLYFTVECWAKPDAESLANDNKLRTLVERAIWADNASAADETLMRKNFQIGIKGGRWYAAFDSSGTDKQPVAINDGPMATTNWTHVAATYDGEALRLYINGVCNNNHNTSIQPEHGILALSVSRAGEINPNGGTLSSAFITILVGASAATQHGIIFDWAWRYRSYLNRQDDPSNIYGLAEQTTLADYENFYKGYIDEVRIWDGARTAAAILSDVDNRTRYSFALADENRQAVYNSWKVGGGRSPADSTQLPAQLMYHWAFDHLTGAVEESDVTKVPAGFNTAKNVLNAKAKWSRPDDYVETRWANSEVHSTVYNDYAWVPWINNTVSHLPRFDQTTLDSFYWSEDYAGEYTASTYGYDSFTFPRTAETYSRWHQMEYSISHYYDNHFDREFTIWNKNTDPYYNLTYSWATKTRFYAITDYSSGYYASTLDEETNSTDTVWTDALYRMRFAARDRNLVGDDLLPMGGAYPRRISIAEGGMWDNLKSEVAKASDAWAQTGNDADGNGLPDWWEQYARANYCQKLSPKDPIEWDTTVTRNGIEMPAYQAYLRDLADGMVKIGSTIKTDPNYADTRDSDSDGLPDWWEELYGLSTTTSNADDDPDNDGLSNYQEYMLGEYYLHDDVFGKVLSEQLGIDTSSVKLSPILAFSTPGQVVPDYFLRYTDELLKVDDDVSHFYANEYFGEIATDHDFMEDWWEQLYDITYTNSKKYDPSFDKDGDGWSTFAECRASLWWASFTASMIDKWTGSESTQHVSCYPQPIIGVRATYYGLQDISGKQLIVRATSGQTQRTDATFVIPPYLDGQTRFIGGFLADTTMHGHLSPGMINANSVVFDYARVNSDKVYTWNCDWYKENSPSDVGWDKAWLTDASGVSYYGWITWQDCGRTHTGDFDEYKSEFSKWPHIELEGGDFEWEAFASTVPSADLSSATFFANGTTQIGTLDCTTGEYELDMSKLVVDGSIEEYVFRVTYTSRLGHEWPQTVYVSDTKELESTGLVGIGDGHVREGKNTIEAFIDLDEDGAYTAGEPYGVVQNVDVGWHKVPTVVIEMKDTSHVVPRFNLSTLTDDRTVVEGSSSAATETKGQTSDDETSGLTKTIKIRRTAINGNSTVNVLGESYAVVPQRTLLTKTLVLDSRAYLTEADVLGNAKFDLDSRWLVNDAVDKLGITRSEIDEATYEIFEVLTLDDGTTTNKVLKTFVNKFNPQRIKPSVVSPVDSAPVYASSPTFAFTSGDETMTAYRLQIRRKGANDGEYIYDSGDGKDGNYLQLLPGQVPNTAGVAVYEVTPPVYVNARVCSGMYTNAVFTDSADYQWRVALFNAKFNEIEKEDDWSDWADFQMDVANTRRYPYMATGYGNASISVRYYGPTNVTADKVWIEAFENADFRGQPAARTTLSSVKQLADYTDIVHTNALVNGLAPGTYYFRAFIDFNGNGQRDDWESWGYYNYVGKGMKALNNPHAFTVSASTADWVMSDNSDFTIYIEDCDTDQNEIPDCLEAVFYAGSSGSSASDSDGDGIADSEEESYSTNSQLPDTDNDGMPDGYEAKFADTDPTLSDADEYAEGDVMAFAECDVVLVVVKNGSVNTTYALQEGEAVPTVGTDANNLNVTTTYTYPIMVDGKLIEYLGSGTNLTLNAGRVEAVNENGSIVLIHDQVYDKFGFSPKTATAADDAVNTKPFTALDKYLVVRYLEALGKADEDAVNRGNGWKQYTLKPYETDFDGDGIADGWELYVGLDPWNYDDARELSAGGEGLTNLEEYDGGYLPTDPANADTDEDNVSDLYACRYHLKGDDAGEDNDGDNLSNYAEYLISEVFKFAQLDPDKAKTDDSCVDYFRKCGNLYFGEIFTDHDQVEDLWEQRYNGFANRYVYDPTRDDDGDGWSNWAEAKAGTNPGTAQSPSVDGSVPEYPIPTIAAKVVYSGSAKLVGPLVFKAWSCATKGGREMTDLADAVWMASADDSGTNVNKYVGVNPGTVRNYHLGTGSVKPGSLRILFRDQAFKRVAIDQDGNVSLVSDGQVGNARWYQFVEDVNGALYTSSTNTTRVQVGTVDYASGLVSVDFSLSALQGLAYEKPTNGSSTDGSDTKAESTYSNYDQLDLSQSYVCISWTSLMIDTAGNTTYYLSDCYAAEATADGGTDSLTELSSKGHVREGLNKFVVFSDSNSDGEYTVGEPFGFVRDVDVGWQGGSFEVRLTETSPIFARINLMSTAGQNVTSSDEEEGDEASGENAASDRQYWQQDVTTMKLLDQEDKYNKSVEFATDTRQVRVRVLRTAIDDMSLMQTNSLGILPSLTVATPVLDKYFDFKVRKYLHEGDFLGDDSFDCDWDNLAAIMTNVPYANMFAAAKATYTIFFGEHIYTPDLDGKFSGTNYVFQYTVDRVFDTGISRATRVVAPVIDVTKPGFVFGARPTFTWAMQDSDGVNYTSYTAFKLQIFGTDKKKPVYDSGFKLLPACDSDGWYSWQIDQPINQAVGALCGEYTWRVAMYNSKFKDYSTFEEFEETDGTRRRVADGEWSDYGTLVLDINRQQSMNDHGYSTIAAAVKYAGPEAVLEDDVDVYLQAFSTADFSGVPVGETLLTDYEEIADTSHNTANGYIHGLPQDGTYYLRAFIDTNGNGVKDEWESWGAASEAVTISSSDVTVPTVGIYIEDADTDGDWIPDAYAYKSAKDSIESEASVGDGDTILFRENVDITTLKAGISTGLSGASLTIFQNEESTMKTLLGLSSTASISEIRRAVEKNVKPDTVKITALTLAPDGKTVSLSVAAEVTESIGGKLWNQIYNQTAGETAKVKIRVYTKKTLATAEWTQLGEDIPAEVGAGAVQVDVDVSAVGIDMSSGFYRIEVIQ